MPTVASQMPVTFSNGSSIHQFKGECSGCDCELVDDSVHGAVVKHSGSMFAVEACGVCHDCNLVTRFVYRFHDDMTITGPRGNGWHTWGGKKSTWLESLRQFIKGAV
jgi:hypothetical protein